MRPLPNMKGLRSISNGKKTKKMMAKNKITNNKRKINNRKTKMNFKKMGQP